MKKNNTEIKKENVFKQLDDIFKINAKSCFLSEFKFFIEQDSDISKLTVSDIDEYNNNREWNVYFESSSILIFKIPFLRTICSFGLKNQFKEISCIVNSKNIIIGNLSSDGDIVIDLSKIYYEEGLFAHKFNKFVFIINTEKYEIYKEDIMYDMIRISAKSIK
jgi:hypothetical protein